MSRVTSKLQVTIPKAIAEPFGIKPGDEVEWVAAGGTIQLLPCRPGAGRMNVEERLRLFRAATERQRQRNAEWSGERDPADRGWTREELYQRGGPR
jgi:AbrB family looped-hinge helix DNA binding protein